MFCSYSEKIPVNFTIVRYIAVTIYITINNIRAKLFIKGIFKMKWCFEFSRWLKINFEFFLQKMLAKINLYHKPTFSGFFTNFESFIPLSYKSNLLNMLLFRTFNLCSSFELFHQQIVKLKLIYKKNGYPNSIDTCIKRFLDFSLRKI